MLDHQQTTPDISSVISANLDEISNIDALLEGAERIACEDGCANIQSLMVMARQRLDALFGELDQLAMSAGKAANSRAEAEARHG